MEYEDGWHQFWLKTVKKWDHNDKINIGNVKKKNLLKIASFCGNMGKYHQKQFHIYVPNLTWSSPPPSRFLHWASSSQHFQGKEGCVQLPFIHRHVSSTQMLVQNFTTRHAPPLHQHHTWGPGGQHSRLYHGPSWNLIMTVRYEDDFQIDSNYNFFRKTVDVGRGGGGWRRWWRDQTRCGTRFHIAR